MKEIKGDYIWRRVRNMETGSLRTSGGANETDTNEGMQEDNTRGRLISSCAAVT